MERSPAHRITQLCATFICHCWIVVLVTTGDTFHNGLKQSLWKQSFWFAINNPPTGAYVCIVQEMNSLSFTGKQKEMTHIQIFLYKCVSGASLTDVFTMKEMYCRCYESPHHWIKFSTCPKHEQIFLLHITYYYWHLPTKYEIGYLPSFYVFRACYHMKVHYHHQIVL